MDEGTDWETSADQSIRVVQQPLNSVCLHKNYESPLACTDTDHLIWNYPMVKVFFALSYCLEQPWSMDQRENVVKIPIRILISINTSQLLWY